MFGFSHYYWRLIEALFNAINFHYFVKPVKNIKRSDSSAPVCRSVLEEIMINISGAMVRYGFL